MNGYLNALDGGYVAKPWVKEEKVATVGREAVIRLIKQSSKFSKSIWLRKVAVTSILQTFVIKC